MKFLSIIVPIYNVELYLKDCLKSLLEQNIKHDEYEIICIDDGSKDNSANIVREFATKYDNIKLISKDNGGVSSARNVGLLNSNGKYIWFVDSDDCIRANCLRYLKNIIEKNDPDFIKFKYKSIDENYKFENDDFNDLPYTIQTRLNSSSNVFSTIVKSEIISNNNIKFNENLKYGEDTLFQYYVYLYRNSNNSSIVVDGNLYLYRNRSCSAMNVKTKKSFTKHTEDLIEMARIYAKDYENKITNVPEKLENIKLRQHLAIEGALTILPKSNLNLRTTIRTLKNEGLYPYPIPKWKLKEAKRLSAKIEVLVKFLFKYPFFYKIYYLIKKAK